MPPAYTSQQRTLMARFSSVTSATNAVAAKRPFSPDPTQGQPMAPRTGQCKKGKEKSGHEQFQPLLQLSKPSPSSRPRPSSKQPLHERDPSWQALIDSYRRVERHLLLSGPDWVGDSYVGEDEDIQIRQQLERWQKEKPFQPTPPAGDSYHIAFFDELETAARKKYLIQLFKDWFLAAIDPDSWIQPGSLLAMMRFAHGRLGMTTQHVLGFLDVDQMRVAYENVLKLERSQRKRVKRNQYEGHRPILLMDRFRDPGEEHVSRRYEHLVKAGTAFPGTLNEEPKIAINATEGPVDFPSESEAKVMVMLEHPIEMFRECHIDYPQLLSAIQDIMMEAGMIMNTDDLPDLIDDEYHDSQIISYALVKDAKRLSLPLKGESVPTPAGEAQPSPRISLKFSLKAKFTSIFNDFTRGHIELCDALGQFSTAGGDPNMSEAELLQLFEKYGIPADMFLDVRRDGDLFYFAIPPRPTHGLPNLEAGGATAIASRSRSLNVHNKNLPMQPTETQLPPTPKLAYAKLPDSPPVTPIVPEFAKNAMSKAENGNVSGSDVNMTTNDPIDSHMPDTPAASPAPPDFERALTPFPELTHCPGRRVVDSESPQQDKSAMEQGSFEVPSKEWSATCPPRTTPRRISASNDGNPLQNWEASPSTSSTSSNDGQTVDLWGINMPTKKAKALGRTLGLKKAHVKHFFKSSTPESRYRAKLRHAKDLTLFPLSEPNALGVESRDSDCRQERRFDMSELFAHDGEDTIAFVHRKLLPLKPEDFVERGQPNVKSYCSSPETYVSSNIAMPHHSTSAPASPALKRKRTASKDIAQECSQEDARKYRKTESRLSPAQSLVGHLESFTIVEPETSTTNTSAFPPKLSKKTLDGQHVSCATSDESMEKDSSPELEDGEIFKGVNAITAKRRPSSPAPKVESNSMMRISAILENSSTTRDTGTSTQVDPVTAPSRRCKPDSSEQKHASFKNAADLRDIATKLEASNTSDGVDARAEKSVDSAALTRALEQCELSQETRRDAMNVVKEIANTNSTVASHNMTLERISKSNISRSSSGEVENQKDSEAVTIKATKRLPLVYETVEGAKPKDCHKRSGRTGFPKLDALSSSESASPAPLDVQMRDASLPRSSGMSTDNELSGLRSIKTGLRTTQKPDDVESIFARVNNTIEKLLGRPGRRSNMFTDYNYDPDSPLTKSRTRAWNHRGGPLRLDALAQDDHITVPALLRQMREDRVERVDRIRELADHCRESGRYLHQTQNSNSPGSSRASSVVSLNKLFDKYRDDPINSPDTLTITPTIAYFTALSLALDEPAVLALLTILSAPTMGELTRDGFVAGWRSLSPSNATADTIAKQMPIAQGLRQSLKVDAELWERVYKHTFILARQLGQKAVQLEVAVEYWRLLFGNGGWQWRSEDGGKETPWLKWYLEHLTTNWKKSVNKDLWDQTAKFARKSVEDPSMDWWSEDGAWPGVLDDFVGFVKGKRDVS